MKYPYVGRYVRDNGEYLEIRFISPKTGTVVRSTWDSFRVGHKNNGWGESSFTRIRMMKNVIGGVILD